MKILILFGTLVLLLTVLWLYKTNRFYPLLKGMLGWVRTTTRPVNVLFTVIASSLVRSTDQLYEMIGTQPGLGNYLNLGWWEDSPHPVPENGFNMKDQCDELVRKVGELAQLRPDERILDVGFGYGEQDFLWRKEFNCNRIIGVNITHEQVAEAAGISRENNWNEELCFLTGSATELPFPENSFDKIIGLESPFHFRTREIFFDEAHRVLRSGGTLVTADIINGYPPGEGAWSLRVMGSVHDWFWQVPKENHSTPEMYRSRLREKGFSDVNVRDVTDHVLTPGITSYIHWRWSELPGPIGWLIGPFVRAGIRFYESDYLRYVLAFART